MKKLTSLMATFTVAAACMPSTARAQAGAKPQSRQNSAVTVPQTVMLTEREAIINHVIDEFEGTRYTNKKHDRGGATKFGISKELLKTYRGCAVSNEDVKKLTRADAVRIYTVCFWDKMKADKLPASLRCIIFDMAINHGVYGPSGAMLQRSLNQLLGPGTLSVDGKIGPLTVNAANQAVKKFGAEAVLKAVIEQRKAFYENIIKEDPSQAKWRKGWNNRANWFLEHIDQLIPPQQTQVSFLNFPRPSSVS